MLTNLNGATYSAPTLFDNCRVKNTKGELKQMKKFFAIATLALALVASAFAQTTYTAPKFSVNFTGPVTTKTFNNNANTSTRTNYAATSANGIVEEVMTVDIISDGVLPVDYSSSDFYRANNAGTGETLTTDNLSNGLYQGHPYSYGCYLSTYEGVNYIRFTRFIIVNAKEAIFISMFLENSPNAVKTPAGAFQVWQDFENSLDIK
jgi:hypothetical protein